MWIKVVKMSSPRSKILVVDDKRVIADTLRAILDLSGFEATAAYDGQDAIDVARAWPPDVLLTDVMMPRLNGIEAAIQILILCPACRVLLISGSIGAGDLIQEARERGYDFEVLAKPTHPADLLARLRSILA
jgi:CheY-like chemotaxis protein